MEKLIKLDDLLKCKWWEEVKKAVKKRQVALANKIVYWDCIDVKDPNLTAWDLLRAEMRALAWVVEKLPTDLVENPNYDPAKEEIPEIDWEAQAQLIEDMFKQAE